MPLSMDRWISKVAIVTGAGSGIGAAIAEALVEEGVWVVGLEIHKDRVDALAKKLENKKGRFYPFEADVSKEEDILRAFKWTIDGLGPIHILVNNAGVATNTNLMQGDTQLWRKVLDVNVMGLSIATREAVKNMRENNVDGHIIHINSIFGHKIANFARLNMYGASKHAVTALTETLRNELNSVGSKIKITGISPGFVKTNIMNAAGFDDVAELLKKMKMLEPQDIADGAIYVLSTPPHVQVHELTVKPIAEPF